MKAIFRKTAIIGVGLIGGSIALGMKKYNLTRTVVGAFRRDKSLQEAKKNKIIDYGYLDIETAVSGADLIIFAAPVAEIIKIAKEIKTFVSKTATITDVGSTKSEVVKELSKLYPDNYLGSHPLAGSEKKGCFYSSADLFKGKITILTPHKNSNPKITKSVKILWEKLGSMVISMDADMHDELLSRLSHLPHLLMYALMNFVNISQLKYASTGFRDATRIAASNVEMWSQIFISNRKFIVKDIDLYIKQLKKYRDLIRKSDRAKITSQIKNAADKRRQLR